MPEPLVKTYKNKDGFYDVVLSPECSKMLEDITTALNQRNEAETLLFLLRAANSDN